MRINKLRKFTLVALNVFPDAISIFVLALVLELLYRLAVWFGWLAGGMESLLFYGLVSASVLLAVIKLPAAWRLWNGLS